MAGALGVLHGGRVARFHKLSERVHGMFDGRLGEFCAFLFHWGRSADFVHQLQDGSADDQMIAGNEGLALHGFVVHAQAIGGFAIAQDELAIFAREFGVQA